MQKVIDYPEQVTLVEVGPRDGLQNESVLIDSADKVELIENLVDAGIKRIECGSFVSPKWVPQMANSDQVLRDIKRTHGVKYSALTPNLKGLEGAIIAKADEVAVFGAASESFSKRNINCSIEESFERFRPLAEKALQEGIPVRGYVSCVLGCPYEGDVSPEQVLKVSQALLDMGCYEISLGDTIGTGTPVKTAALLSLLQTEIPKEKLAVHFHDTYGQALANILIALQHGITVIDAAVSGLGGCPYAKGASGNVATEEVLYMLDGMNISTNIDIDKVQQAGAKIMQRLGRETQSKVSLAKR